MATKNQMTKLLEIHEHYIEKLLKRGEEADVAGDEALRNLLRDAAALLSQHADDIRDAIAQTT